MPLFQTSVVNKHLKLHDKQAIKTAYGIFKAHFFNSDIQNNIRSSKEEQYQGEFLIDLFVNVLGYTKSPSSNFNLTTEYKNVKDSKKADGAIIFGNEVKAVIELKGTNTVDLGSVEVQAFGYKNNQPACVYVITSNFQKLRFYIDNAIEFIEFNLFTLTESEFEMLYLCLARQNVETNLPQKIKAESLSHEDEITKKLYRDYTLFKSEMHKDLVANNPAYDSLLLFKKTQKLLSRFLFLLFAEDRQLLPPNSVRLILNQWKELKELDEYIPLYSRFRKYFGHLNTGFRGKHYEVFAYNGGLFKPDEILDSVQINDEILYKHTLKLSDYDFASDVDVNILGHIFENSLNELDELKAEIAGDIIDKSKSKRKKDGVFYTPKYITKYIVDNTVGKLCEQKKAEFGIVDEDYYSDKKRQKKTILALSKKLTSYRNWLLQITICDPACGSGAFLNQALNFLINEHGYIDELQARLFGDALILSDIENTILENNLFGVDLNEESVEIAKLSLWLRTAKPNRKLNDLSNNIKCGNSLIDDPDVAGEKAFNWEQEFPQVFGKSSVEQDLIIVPTPETLDYIKLIKEISLAAKTKAEQAIALSKEAAEMSQKVYEYAEKLAIVSEPTPHYGLKKGFDVVIGNPPYFNIQTLGIGSKVAQCIQKTYPEIWQDKSDILFYFIYKALQISKSEVGFIVSNAFLFSDKASKLRNFILEDDRLAKIVNFEQFMVFEDASITSCISLFSNHKKETKALIFKEKNYSIDEIDIALADVENEFVVKLERNNVFALVKNDIAGLNKKIDGLHPLLQDVAYLGKGMETAADNVFLFNNYPAQFPKEFVKKRVTGLNIDRYVLKSDSSYILYFENIDAFDKLPEAIQKHLTANREILSNRADKKRRSTAKWWNYTFAMHKELYNLPKLYCSRRAFGNTFCYDEGFDYLGFSNMTVIFETNDKTSIKYILALLNSKLLNFRYKSIGKQTGGGSFEYFPNGVGKLPIPNSSFAEQQPFISKANLMLSLNKELQELSGKFQRSIQRKFEIEDLPPKLQNWYLITYAEFIKELGKKKIKLTLSQEEEWESHFIEKSELANAIKSQIDNTDKEIDSMVYALYELNAEDIWIIEN